MKQRVTKIIEEAVLGGSEPIADFNGRAIEILLPKEEKFGDFSTNIAMVLASTLKKNPRQIAKSIVERIETNRLFSEVTIAGPGFINVRITDEAWIERLANVFEQGNDFGRIEIGAGVKVLVEFVSANPTGPLHIGHGRGAAVGDAIARILSFAGYDATTEYYINDVGLQMDNLGRSLLARANELEGRPADEPTYKGEYMIDVARSFLDKYGSEILDAPKETALTPAREFAASNILSGIKTDLKDFNVEFNEWFSEATLHENKEVDKTIEKFVEEEHIYINEGAYWLKTETAKDEKDRVVRRANGITTYLAADMAYHKNKFDRGYDTLVDIWGADHHGYIPRMKAVVTALGHNPDDLVVLLAQIVSLKRGGKVVAMSTRSGVFTTLREILDEVGPDATRFFFLMRSSDSQLEFDVDLAKEKSSENPVYYVQYAHARCANIFITAKDKGVNAVPFDEIDSSLLKGADEIRLIKKLLTLPDTVSACAVNYSPWTLTTYLMETAALFHRFYKNNRVVGDDEALSKARLSLVAATKTVLSNGLNLLGVSAPERM